VTHAGLDLVANNTGIGPLIEQSVVGGTLFTAFGVSVVGPFTIGPTGPLSSISGNATRMLPPGTTPRGASRPSGT